MNHGPFSCLFITTVLVLTLQPHKSWSTTTPPPPPGNQDPTQQEPHDHNHHEIPQYYQPPDPKVVKEALDKLFDEHLDVNKDHYVDAEEMKTWLKKIHASMIEENVGKQWDYFVDKLDAASQSLSWQEYRKITFPEDDLAGATTGDRPEEVASVKEQLQRTERRWRHADDNGDGLLNRSEFGNFLHPEENPAKSGIVVEEAIEMMDKDGDKSISLEEYMDHLKSVAGPEKEDEGWLKEQQEHFTTYLDMNKDGALDESEMRAWVLPSFDREEGEAWRFISFGESDRDTRLTKTDFAQNHEHFMGLLPAEFWMDNAEKHDGKQLNDAEKDEL